MGQVYGGDTAKMLAGPRGLVPGLVAGASVAALASDAGGFDPTSWGWSAIALLLVLAASLLLGARRLSLLELALPAALASLTAWIWLSLLWSSDVTQTVQEGERMLLYLAATAALLFVGRRADVEGILASLAVAITAICAYALAVRLLAPARETYQVLSADPQASFRLARPLGYANALALFAALGILLALGFGLHGRRLAFRALGSSALVVLAPTLYFTYGRGAWLALAAGGVAFLALEHEQLAALASTLVLALAPAIAVVLASRAHPLTIQSGSFAAARHDGRLIAGVLLILFAAAALVPAALERALRRITLGPSARRSVVAVLVLVAVGVFAAGLAQAGGPRAAMSRAYRAFTSPAPLVKTNESQRLFSLSGNSRSEYWHVAWSEYEDRPWLGGGAGSFQRFWLRHRRVGLPVLDAHSLYLETLAELGPLGLALLLCALVTPLRAVAAARRHPLATAALGAYVAFLVHAGIDWDWEMPAVTLAALACGVGLLLAARGAEIVPLTRSARGAGLALSALLAAVALVGLLGNRAAASSSDALDRAELHTAATDARNARRWEPWSVEPWRLLGESQLQAGEVEQARRSFLRGIAKDRGDWEVWLDLALATRGGERRDALDHVAFLNPLSSELRDLRGSS
jgi:O-antigen ligase